MSQLPFYKRPLFSFLNKAEKTDEEQPKMKWVILPFFGRFLRRSCTAIGAMFLISMLVGVVVSLQESVPELPERMVLYLPLEHDFPEHEVSGFTGLESFVEQPLTIRDVITALDAAAKDDRVEGIVAELKGGGYSIAHLQALHTALVNFRETNNKFAYIYSSSYADSGKGLGTYYLASAFDEIWMQPMGSLSIAGMNAEMPFARDLLDKLGVTPEFFARKEYKSLFESLTNSEMSDATREAMGALIEDLAGQMVSGISEGRLMSEGAFKAHIDTGLLTDGEAHVAGLIDRVDYADILTRELWQDLTGDPDDAESVPFVDLGHYARASTYEIHAAQNDLPADEERTKVALIYAVGAIMDDGEGAPYGEQAVSAEETADNIMMAANDDDVQAIVLRVDSPGGSPTASETIRRAVLRAQEKGKTVIVSMGGMAASGGYWISAPADRIFALPGTLTGSIGVAGGKFVFEGLWEKLGVNWDGVSYGENAGIWSMNKLLSDSERERFNAMMDQIYDGFVARVAEGRGMTLEQADKVARGRVWTGAQAQERGLVDELGGLNVALDYVAVGAGLSDRHDLDIVVLPRPLTPVEQIVELFEGQVMMGDVLRSYLPAVKEMDGVLRSVRAFGDGGVTVSF